MGRALVPRPGALALTVLFAACSQAPPAETPAAAARHPVPVLEPVAETVAGEPAEAEDEPSPPPAEAPKEAVAERKSDASAHPATASDRRDATVIEVPGPAAKPRTLWEAAVAAREKRQDSPPPRTSVTDQNLHEFQNAELTIASPRPPTGAGGAAEEGSGEAKAPERGEDYWRSRVRDLRLRLRAAVDELAELDERAAGLRRSFYAADDPYVRDAEIKPEWDRALDRLGEVRREIVLLASELEDALEEGRQAGALPGWLREGIELEPEPEELPRPRERTHEPGEPTVVEIEPPSAAGT